MWIFPLKCHFLYGIVLNHLQNRGWNLANRCVLAWQRRNLWITFSFIALWLKWCEFFFLSHLQIPWIFLNLFNELILGWWISGLKRLVLFIWCAMLMAICWGLWKERNSRIFEDKYRSQIALVTFIYNILFEWVSVWLDYDESVWYAIWSEKM